MKYLLGFLRFWYGFIVGDDWRIAVGAVAAIGLTAIVAGSGVATWWLLPGLVIAVLVDSVRRGAH